MIGCGMKKRVTIILVGLPVALILGFIGYCYFIFVAFENRESHNGVGYSAFYKSIRKHVQSGPHHLSDMRSYEGTWWFTVTDPSANSYDITLSRHSFVDARDMQSLQRGGLSVQRINSKDLVCENNFDETVRASVIVSGLGVSKDTPTSLNALVDKVGPLLSEYGDSLPITYGVAEGEVEAGPEWLSIPLERCRAASENLEPPTSVTCRLVESATGEIAIN